VFSIRHERELIRVVLVGIALLGLAAGCGSTGSSIRPGALELGDVEKVFAEEDLPLANRARNKRAIPATLTPAKDEQFPSFVVYVYGRHQTSEDLGMVIVERGFDVVRVENVVVGFDPRGSIAPQVQTAIERLRRYESD